MLAEDLRTEFVLPEDQPLEVVSLLERLAISTDRITLRDSRIRAVTLLGHENRTLWAFNENAVHSDPQQARRFSAAHELCHLLFDRYRARWLALRVTRR